jgi:hypothetical protein
MTPFLAALLLALPPKQVPAAATDLEADVHAIGAGKAPCGRLFIRLTLWDDDHYSAIELGGGTVRFQEGDAQTEAALPPADCRRIARQLASRYPKTARWPKLWKRIRASRADDPGRTELTLRVGRRRLDLVVGEDLVQDVGFVAVLRAELSRLRPVASAPPVPPVQER